MTAKTWGIVTKSGYVVTFSIEEMARKFCDEWNKLPGMSSGAPYRVAEFVEVVPAPDTQS